MYIESVAIESFGSYKNYALSFERGVNIIEGPNESGKTTLGAFIKFIFYGLAKKAPSQGALSEVKRYRSWENDLASGSLVLEYNGKKYRIERILKPGTRAQESVKIVDVEAGVECFKGEHPGRLFFGVDEDAFAQTAYVGQADGGKVNGKPISAAIENMLFSGDETVSTASAQKKLEDARVLLKYKVRRGGKISELQDKIELLKSRRDSAETVKNLLSRKENEKKELLSHYEKEKEELDSVRKRLERADLREKLNSFEYFDTLVRNAEEKKKEYDARLDEISFDGFVPDEKYLRDIESYASETERINAKISQLEINGELPEDAELTDEENALLEKIGRDGSVNALEEKAKNISASEGKFASLAMVFLIGGSALAMIAAALLMFDLLPAVITAILSAGAFSASAVALSKAHAMRKEYQTLADKYSPISLEDIREISDKIEKKRYLKGIYEQKSSALNEKRSELLNEREEYIGKIKVLLSKWGKEYLSTQSAYEIARSAREELTKLKNCEMQKENAEKQMSDYAAKLPTLDRIALEKALEESSLLGDIEEGRYESVKRDYENRVYENRSVEEDIKTLDIEMAKLSASAEDTDMISDEIAALTAQMTELEICHDGYMLAIQSIANASDRLRSDVAPHLAKRASEMMNKETRGKYSNIGVSESMSLEYGHDAQGIGNIVTREIEYLSEGTKDLAYVSLRLALVEMLYTKAKPPILFDESFARLDDKRLENTFSLLGEIALSGYQVFVFTSQKRDSVIMERVGEAKHILLE